LIEPENSKPGTKPVETFTDPVCGMQVDPQAGKPNTSYQNNTYHFCAARCHDRFTADPWFFLSGRNHDHAALNAQSSAIYICPMDPEVQNEGPGTCPVCGMALEPASGVAEGPNEELEDFTSRFKWSVLLTIPLVLVAMGPMMGLPLTDWVDARILRWLELLLATAVVWIGKPFFERGWSSVKTGNLNMWTLISLGVGAAYIYSVVATVLPGAFPEPLVKALAGEHGAHGLLPVFFEAAAVIIALVFAGQMLELRAREKTGDAIRALVNLAPQSARRVLPDGEEYDAPLANILPDDQLRVRPGERIPVDGFVLEGSSTVDESLLTGESIPVSKHTDDAVSAGTFNHDGTFVMQASRVGEQTALGQIVTMVANAQRSRSPMQNLADRVARWFVPGVVLIAVLALLVWWWLGPDPSLAFAITAAVSVLIVACPCALGLATPMSVTTASGRGAASGILVRDAAALDRLAEVDTMVLDKTGTLTEGKPVLVDVVAVETVHASTHSKEELLAIAGLLEQGSEHPLAQAITNGAADALEAFRRTHPALEVNDFHAIHGQGVAATIQGKATLFGNRLLMQTHAVPLTDAVSSTMTALEAEAKTVMLLAQEDTVVGLLAVADKIRDGAAQTLQQLSDEGIRIVMATGDNPRTAEAVASTLGIRDFYAELLPEHKLKLIRQLQTEGHVVAMAGDGINDSPSLAQADVGIAMGSGADVALESAGITLLHSNLDGLVKARRLATATRRNIKQNLLFAFGYNSLGIPLAAGVLYPFFGWLLSPMFAAAAMALSSVSVIANALRLRRLKL